MTLEEELQELADNTCSATVPISWVIDEFGKWLARANQKQIKLSIVKDDYLYVRQAIYTGLVTEGRRAM